MVTKAPSARRRTTSRAGASRAQRAPGRQWPPRPGSTCSSLRGAAASGRAALRSLRLIRSVARSGSQSEASLAIGSLQKPVVGWAAALPDERDLPAGAADALVGQGRGRGAGDPPAGERRRGKRKRIFTRPAPAPQQQGRAAAFLG